MKTCDLLSCPEASSESASAWSVGGEENLLGPGLKSPHSPQEPRWREEHQQFCSWLTHPDKSNPPIYLGGCLKKCNPRTWHREAWVLVLVPPRLPAWLWARPSPSVEFSLPSDKNEKRQDAPSSFILSPLPCVRTWRKCWGRKDGRDGMASFPTEFTAR